MKKITLLAAMALVASAASAQYTIAPEVDNVLKKGKVSDVWTVVLDQASLAKFTAQGANIHDGAVNDVTSHFYVWDGTFNAGDGSYPGVGMHIDGYTSVNVAAVGWSGAGFCEDPGQNFDTSDWNDQTRVHVAYMSNGTVCPSWALIIGDGKNAANEAQVSSPAKLSVGNAFVDQGATFPVVAPACNDDWQGIDLSFADLKKLYPGFSPVACKAWTGNVIALLAGGVTGQNVSLDAVYFYNLAAEGGLNELGVENAAWNVTANAVHLLGGNGIELYNVAGKCVKSVSGSVLGLGNVPAGVYVARSGKNVCKVIVK